MECRDHIEDFYEYQSKLEVTEEVILVAFIFCIIYSAELICVESWIGFKFPKYLWGFIIFRKKGIKFLKGFYIFKFMVALGSIISNLILVVKYVDEYSFYKNELEKSCFD